MRPKSHGFTEIENRTGYALARGLTIDQVAAERGVCRNTVRRQIEKMAEKILNPEHVGSTNLIRAAFARYAGLDDALAQIRTRAGIKRNEFNIIAANEAESCAEIIEHLRFGRVE